MLHPQVKIKKIATFDDNIREMFGRFFKVFWEVLGTFAGVLGNFLGLLGLCFMVLTRFLEGSTYMRYNSRKYSNTSFPIISYHFHLKGSIGCNSAPRRRRGTRIVGNESYKPPGAPQTLQDSGKQPNLCFITRYFTKNMSILMIGARSSIPVVWRSPVRRIRFWVRKRSNPSFYGKTWEQRNSCFYQNKTCFPMLIALNGSMGLTELWDTVMMT